MQTIIGFTCLIASAFCLWAAWHDYSWRYAIACIVFLLIGAICIPGPVRAEGNPPCAVQVVIDLSTYDGPKHFQDLCLSQPALYGDGLLSVEARSMGDGLFRDGFDGVAP